MKVHLPNLHCNMHNKNHIKVRNKKNKGRNIEFIDTASYFYLARLVH